MRTMTAGLIAALAADNVALINLLELDFVSGFVRVHSAAGDVVFNGDTFQGVGTHGGISNAEESEELRAYQVRMTLNGIDPAIISTAFDEVYQGRSARVWAGALTSDYQLIADPILVFSGRMDNMQVTLGERSASIDLTVTNKLADWDRPRIRRYNRADQQAVFPGDKGFDFAEEMVSKTLFWGRNSSI